MPVADGECDEALGILFRCWRDRGYVNARDEPAFKQAMSSDGVHLFVLISMCLPKGTIDEVIRVMIGRHVPPRLMGVLKHPRLVSSVSVAALFLDSQRANVTAAIYKHVTTREGIAQYFPLVGPEANAVAITSNTLPHLRNLALILTRNQNRPVGDANGANDGQLSGILFDAFAVMLLDLLASVAYTMKALVTFIQLTDLVPQVLDAAVGKATMTAIQYVYSIDWDEGPELPIDEIFPYDDLAQMYINPTSHTQADKPTQPDQQITNIIREQVEMINARARLDAAKARLEAARAPQRIKSGVDQLTNAVKEANELMERLMDTTSNAETALVTVVADDIEVQSELPTLAENASAQQVIKAAEKIENEAEAVDKKVQENTQALRDAAAKIQDAMMRAAEAAQKAADAARTVAGPTPPSGPSDVQEVKRLARAANFFKKFPGKIKEHRKRVREAKSKSNSNGGAVLGGTDDDQKNQEEYDELIATMAADIARNVFDELYLEQKLNDKMVIQQITEMVNEIKEMMGKTTVEVKEVIQEGVIQEGGGGRWPAVFGGLLATLAAACVSR